MDLIRESTRCLQIIGALGSTERPLEKAEQCIKIQQAMCKQKWIGNGCQHKQHWTTELIEVLCADEPVIHNDKMEFIPKISILPIDVQRNSLAFLVNHASEIPIFSLTKLLSALQKSLQQQEDEWCRFHISTLHNISNQRGNKQCLAPQEGMSQQDVVSCRQKISESSQKSFDQVCKAVLNGGGSKTAGISRCKMQFDWLADLKLGDSGTILTNQDENTKQQDESSLKRTHKPAEETVINKRLRLEQRDGKAVITNPSDEIGLDDLFPVSSPEGGGTTEGTDVSSTTTDRVVQVDSPTEGGGTTEGTDVTNTENMMLAENNGDPLKVTCAIDEMDDTLKINLDILKTELMSCSAGTTLSEAAQKTMKNILESSSGEALWGALGDIPLIGLECLCQFVVQSIGPAELSYKSALTMASKCFLKKLQDSDTTIPRALASTLFTFTKAFPKPTIEGVILPSIITEGNDAVAAPQFDLVAKLTKDVLADEHTIYLLNGLLHSKDLQWGEHHTTLVQNILNQKLDLDQKTMSILVTSLEHHGISHSACKKFAKLLLFIINQYGKKMTAADIGQMQSLVTANKTFLKKAALNALKKLKPT